MAEKEPNRYSPALAAACGKAYRLTIDAIREAANRKGYAIGVHGSLSRDIDLIACPWTGDAASAEDLAEAVRAAAAQASPIGVAFVAEGGEPCPRPKPHGRLCWSFQLGAAVYIDLSVMPRDLSKITAPCGCLRAKRTGDDRPGPSDGVTIYADPTCGRCGGSGRVAL